MSSSLLNDLNAVDSSLNTSSLNANTKSGRTVLNLPLNRVKLDPQNVRDGYDENHIKELSKSIARDGLLQPISVRPDDANPGEYIINMGHYRYLAHKELNKESIEATIDVKLGSRRVKMSENMIRKDMSLLEIAENLSLMLEEGLLENPKYSYEDIGNELDRSKSWVSRRLALLDSNDYLKDLMKTKIVNDAETGTILKNLLVDFESEVKAKIAEHEGALSSKLARQWSKELKGETNQEELEKTTQPVINEHLVRVQDDESVEVLKQLQIEAEQLVKSEKNATSNSVEAVEAVEAGVSKTESVSKEDNFSTATQKETKEIIKKAKSQFSELDQAYYNGVLDSYKNILNWAESEDAELAAVSKGFLLSFNDENSANLFSWKDLIKHPEIVGELNTILDGMATLKTFVSTSEVVDDRMQVILNQQSLI